MLYIVFENDTNRREVPYRAFDQISEYMESPDWEYVGHKEE